MLGIHTWLYSVQFWESYFDSSVQFSHSFVSDSLQPHGLQQARPPCPSPTPGVYSNSCPLSQWCHPYMTTGKTIALTRQTFVGKVTSLLFNMLCSLVITFLPRSKHLLISWLKSPSAVNLELPKNKVWHCFHCFSIYLPWSDGTNCHDLSFLNVEL